MISTWLIFATPWVRATAEFWGVLTDARPVVPQIPAGPPVELAPPLRAPGDRTGLIEKP